MRVRATRAPSFYRLVSAGGPPWRAVGGVDVSGIGPAAAVRKLKRVRACLLDVIFNVTKFYYSC